jgi:hypothetical protein
MYLKNICSKQRTWHAEIMSVTLIVGKTGRYFCFYIQDIEAFLEDPFALILHTLYMLCQ